MTNGPQGERKEKRYLFDRIGVYLCVLAILALATTAIILIPFDDTYIGESGADAAYRTYFVIMAVAATFIFVLGLFNNAMVWMEGKVNGVEDGAPRSRKLVVSTRKLLGAILSRSFLRHFRDFLADAVMTGKLGRISKARWLFHALIFFGFIGTFILDIVTVIGVDLLRSDSFIDPFGWGKLWIRDFGFELFGLMLLVGLAAASVRRFVRRPKQLVTGGEDVTSILFLFIVVISGFLLEGISIASGLPGHESPSAYSFVGAAFAQFLPSVSAIGYSQLWLVHAAISFAFIAFIPFSKMFHIIASPLATHVEGIIRWKEEDA